MHEFLVSAIAFIILIGLMVIVHEFGHFAVAKFFKVRVEAFSFGFGPRLFGFKYGETDYKVCLLPLGGFVKMTGENFAEVGDAAAGEANIAPLEDPGAFTSHPRWQRMLIGVAGPAANFILAFVLMVFYFGWINEVPDVRTTTVEWVTPGSVADHAGLRAGDVVRHFATADNPDWETFHDQSRAHQNQTVPVTVDRNGQLIQTSLPVTNSDKGRDFDLTSDGLFVQLFDGPIRILEVVPGTPAEKAGLQGGDSILAVDGHSFHTIEPLLDYLQTGKGKPVTLTVAGKQGAPRSVTVYPSVQDGGLWRLGFTANQPADPPVRVKPLGFGDAIGESETYTSENFGMIMDVLRKLFTHQVSVKQLSGPLGIAVAAGQAANTRYWYPKFGLAAGISINLGIMNLLPFPILDGGMILLLLIESTIRRDISMVIKERIYQAAFVVLMAFFAFVIFNDVTKLSIFTHIKP
jgi:regulator of sigma E protease